MRGVLYHFKYLQDFIPHAREEVGRGQHWQGAAEYRRYSETAQAAGDDLVLKDERSVRFEDGDQMETEGVMLCPDDLAGRIGRKAVKIP
jgi:hypothetical protein